MSKIALLPGDGIGPEVVAEGRKVLEAAGRLYGIEFEFQEFLVGGIAADTYGVPLRPEDLEAIKSCDAILLGAVGGPKYDQLPVPLRPEQALFALRGGLGLFANLRPVTVSPALIHASTLKTEVIDGVDLVIVRELTGGIYFGRPRHRTPVPDGDGEIATDTCNYSTMEIRRIVRLAFELARGRRRHVTSVDKANVLESSRLWREVASEVAKEFPDVEYQHQLVDNTAMQLVRNPKQFDVVVTENLFGDILSDEAAMLTGSLGMLPSASIGGRTALYEPCHGSAPDIAGQGKANPLATILSAALLLRHSLGREDAAKAIEAAVTTVLASGARTADIAGAGGAADAAPNRLVGTAEMGDLVVAALKS